MEVKIRGKSLEKLARGEWIIGYGYKELDVVGGNREGFLYSDKGIHQVDIKTVELIKDHHENGGRNMADMVNHPPHYTAGKVECIEAIAAATTELKGEQAYCTGAAIKYLWRWKLKNGVEDLDKAIWYINRIKEVSGHEQG